MKIKLSQAVTLMSTISKRIYELKDELNQLAFLYVPKGENYELSNMRTFNQVITEIESAEEDLRKLEVQIAKANTEVTIDWNQESLSILEALKLAKALRDKATEYSSFGRNRNNEIDRARSMGGTPVLRVLTYDPALYAEKARKLTRQANKLSALIDDANVENYILFPNYSVYMD
ncbi:hypothetical protein NDS46_30690 (plasmid) [Paenibacillus thiaminolyticus]|uniref:hypothetical protein n=1 Tax=Paenibacillus thiaminolyticus TaxID=49283 RepID=UPI002330BB7E|nr:hypothetical protein [Paenibacillus thiaminolyticus]WCF11715.1 hypothetical protein NDS46_30690 [Paenibacillus thiaminolyticus]